MRYDIANYRYIENGNDFARIFTIINYMYIIYYVDCRDKNGTLFLSFVICIIVVIV